MEELITITKREYNELYRNTMFLECLEAVGVDNWGGYGDATDMMNDMDNNE